MVNSQEHTRDHKGVPIKKKNRNIFIGSSILVILIAAFFIVNGITGVKTQAPPSGGDIIITKSEITETAKFIPYKAGGTQMELVAVKAPDGTIRTAFNTCQVCANSGRGYYKQEGDELVCQNCGNRFAISQVEKQKNGCNPVPILEEKKTDSGSTITISQSYMEQNKALFGNWKKA